MKAGSGCSTKSLFRGGFTLIEVMISVATLTLLVLAVSQMLSNTGAIARSGSKHIDTDTQARAVFDRIGTDIGRMIKRIDVDYYIKQPTGYNGHGNGHAYGHSLQTGQQGSDQFAFYSQVPGYYPTGYATTQQGPISLIAYRVNQDSSQPAYLKLQRMSKGLLWNGVDTQHNTNLNNQNTVLPMVFLPQTISGMGRPWYAAWNNDTTVKSQDDSYEVVGPNVFRFEYYYLLKSGVVTDVPWDQTTRGSTQTSISAATPIGLGDVQAVGVAIAIIDPASRALVNGASSTGLFDLASDLADFKSAHGRGNQTKIAGDMEIDWNNTLAQIASPPPLGGHTSNNTLVPVAAASAIRVYTRYFDLGDE